MKSILPIIIILFISCKPTQKTYQVNEPIIVSAENCPNNGVCFLELIPNKSLIFMEDEFGNLYPVISEGEKTILKYTYKKNPVSKTQDSNYTEIVYAELDKTISELSLNNKNLQTIKLHFGRLCYCKGETGYYPIKNGIFKIVKIDRKTMKINFEFTINKVPQIISKINETIYLKSNGTN
ncbi:hypothetical protein Lupro_07655 [Lutibacter profundi]|uniref:Uncharacterized protein n=1 Tax=Lutibacter profundi TaxID=1622118 RepID=A0A0X8G6T1_9FLAO|nr:hypothetical protein [Lutibacter profundi]AMC11132.1 hypothetical protein Lupro_07655 [Lutibacter profundi]